MKIEEFMNEIKQVESFYGKELTDEQKQIWFKEIKNISLIRFKYITSQVYKTLKFMPKLADILEINSAMGNKQINKNEKTVNCKRCNNTGIILYKKLIDNGDGKKIEHTYGAICSCRQRPKYEGWKCTDVRNRSEFYLPYIEEVCIERI